MTPLPLSVIGGFLGAGKTTLINRLLTGDHGLRLAVLVNDFGAINIDGALLKSAREDTIELTNGCVCCTMSGDLFFAIGDMLDRRPRPDHLIVEASGIADPARIASVALAEKDLRYAGIVTLVDGLNIADQLADPQITEQVKRQSQCADLLAVSKVLPSDPALSELLRGIGLTHWVGAEETATIGALMFGDAPFGPPPDPAPETHSGYVQWSQESPNAMSRADLDARLAEIPPGILRLKALLPDGDGHLWEVHVVGTRKTISRRDDSGKTGIVALGLKQAVSPDVIEAWWCAS